MRVVSIEEHRCLLLGAMDAVHRFCEDCGLRYTLLYGTMIGAVRHSGFIPWDDDIDIGMPRADYEAFRSSFDGGPDGRYRFVDIGTDKDYYLAFGKVVDTRTRVEERAGTRLALGAYVDVFPIDGCPGGRDSAVRFAGRADAWRAALVAKNLQPGGRALCKDLAIVGAKALCSPLSRAKLIEKVDAAARSCPDGGTEYVGELCLGPYGNT